MVVDLHVVVNPDSTPADIAPIIEACRDSGLDGAMFLGANGAPPVESIRKAAMGDLVFFFGIEFMTERGRILWYPENPEVLVSESWTPPASGKRSLDGIVIITGPYGGLIVAGHPFDRSDGPCLSDGIYHADAISAVEVATSSSTPNGNQLALEAAGRLKLPVVGGSRASDRNVGAAATVFLDRMGDQSALVSALRRGDAWVIELIEDPEMLGESEETAPASYRNGERGGRLGREPSQGGSRFGMNGGQVGRLRSGPRDGRTSEGGRR